MARSSNFGPRVLTFILCFVAVMGDSCFADEEVDFSRDIRPIFSDKCYLCHGPDESSREAGFRLDLRESATAEADSGETPIVAGEPQSSELLRRVMSDDEYEFMPPADSHKGRLTPRAIELLRKWIASGAEYQKHWALIPPVRPELVDNETTNESQHPIDRLVAARLKKEGLQFSPPADKRTLVRRVTLDLTGLPPTPEEIQAFVSDPSDDAYENLVDRLLNSDHYGEHMSRFWLDAVRYGDTHGLHLDNYREVWPYRDWVIRAFNQNMPWDEFTTKQLAGDLLDNPSTDDLVASGFNRLHITTNEGGTIPEEAQVRNVIDRVETVGTVYLGMTVGCAVCHDHKFDPIGAKEFYSMYAFFSNLDANPMDGNAKSHAPVIKVPSEDEQEALAQLDEQIAALTKDLDKPIPEIDKAQAQWETEWEQRLQDLWEPARPISATSTGGSELSIDEQGIVAATGPNPEKDVYEIVVETQSQRLSALRLKALVDLASKQKSNGRGDNGNAVLSEIEVAIRPLNDDNKPFEPIKLVSALADHSQNQFPIQAAIDGKIDDATGWATEGFAKKDDRTAVFVASSPFGFQQGTEIRLRLHFVSKYARHTFGNLQLALTADGSIWPVAASEWNKIGPFSSSDSQTAYHTEFGPEKETSLGDSFDDGKLTWQPASDLVDGEVLPLTGGIGAWYFYRELHSPDQRTLPVAFGSDDGIRVWLDGTIVHENNVARAVQADQDAVNLELQPGTNKLLVKIVNFGGAAGIYFNRADTKRTPDLAMMRIMSTPTGDRAESQREQLKNFYRKHYSDRWARLAAELDETKQERDELESSFPTTLVMKELAEPKPVYLLKRGQYDQPDNENGPLVADVPGAFVRLPEGAPRNRYGFAKWLTDPEHPLMSRVTVNRFWQQLFGRGFVATSGDFGSQGAWPSHPELLDWLAVEFRESGWDVKRLMKTIVMSQTYRQTSRVSDELRRLDPANRLLARGPRFRMDAETLRDQALAVSGLLVHKIGGPGVKPPQPSGIWKSVAYVGSNTDTFKKDSGPENVHRRSIYTFWKRTAPPPQLSTFDAPSREACTVRRERTNTPLQALLMLNDPQYIEAARHLAQRTMLLPDPGVEVKASWMLEVATGRSPTQTEIGELSAVFEDRLAFYQKHPEEANRLVAIGEAPADAKFRFADLAAWTLVANVVLNLDEVITKE